jgi:hypothetical protein
MVDIGLDFKASPKADLTAWQILEVLHENGLTFHGHGCDLGFKLPRNLRELTPWLDGYRRPKAGESLLEELAGRRRSRLIARSIRPGATLPVFFPRKGPQPGAIEPGH